MLEISHDFEQVCMQRVLTELIDILKDCHELVVFLNHSDCNALPAEADYPDRVHAAEAAILKLIISLESNTLGPTAN